MIDRLLPSLFPATVCLLAPLSHMTSLRNIDRSLDYGELYPL